ncbi:UNVERIFIED_CONTAM: hypothetical protein FKN15_015464 [Acipenser sinensis]
MFKLKGKQLPLPVLLMSAVSVDCSFSVKVSHLHLHNKLLTKRYGRTAEAFDISVATGKSLTLSCTLN